jgi:hypothetical protein
MKAEKKAEKNNLEEKSESIIYTDDFLKRKWLYLIIADLVLKFNGDKSD